MQKIEITQEEYERLKHLDRQYNKFTRRVMRALPFFTGLTAATAIATKDIIKYNSERDSFLNQQYIKTLENIYQNHSQEIINNAKEMLSGTNIFTERVVPDAFGFNNRVSSKFEELQESNPELYSKIFYSSPTDADYNQLAQDRGFADFEAYQDFLLGKFPELIDPQYQAHYDNTTGEWVTPEVPMSSDRIQELSYYLADETSGLSEIMLNKHADELLTQGIDVNSLFDSNDFSFGMFSPQYDISIDGKIFSSSGYTHTARTPQEILNLKSDSPLDISTLDGATYDQTIIGIESCAAAAIVGCATFLACEAYKVAKEHKNAYGTGILSDTIKSCSNKLSNFLKREKQEEKIDEKTNIKDQKEIANDFMSRLKSSKEANNEKKEKMENNGPNL